MEKKNIYDAIIIGGGASGLMCAITAKKHDRSKKIAIIEKNDRLGKKIFITEKKLAFIVLKKLKKT